MHTYSFEKLDVWMDARTFVKWIYIHSAAFPTDEKFGLIMQLRRAAVSIVSNLAEGSGRQSPKDQAHFSQIAYGSTIEVITQLILANDLGFIDDKLLLEGRNKLEIITFKIAALRKSQLLNAKP
jgi:four helix bundle protein